MKDRNMKKIHSFPNDFENGRKEFREAVLKSKGSERKTARDK